MSRRPERSPGVYARVRQTVQAVEERLFDWRRGIETGGWVPTDELRGISEEARKAASAYSATPIGLFRRVVRRSGIDPSHYAFVDLGCGKGRTLVLAAEHNFCSVLGVEVDSELCRIAEQNLRRSGLSAPESEVVCADARQVEFPAGNLFIYLYHPFGGAVLEEVAAKLLDVASQPGRAVVIAYNSDPEAQVLERGGTLRRVRLRPLRFWAKPSVSLFYNEAARSPSAD